MKLIIGLGNPTKQYEKTRHNVGFDILSLFQETFHGNFSEFTFEKQHNARISTGLIEQEKVLLVQPQGYYNTSGATVASLMHYYKVSAQEVFVVHDDLDIPLGKMRISKDASAAGNNGVQSIIDSIKTKNFTRIRVGIQREEMIDAADYVLTRFTKDESKQLKEIFKLSQQAIIDCIAYYPNIEKVQNIYN